ncbi:MAG: hypothetical protein J6Y28_06670 [Acholeplasmatales bacterium]|nr:hypothetical protein [Acholeplasmatales bacterium]
MKLSDSQNFLVNKELVKSIVDKAKFNNDLSMLEIGAGKGIITDELMKKYNVTALELDNNLYNDLLKKYSDKNITLLNEDILDYNFDKDYNVFSNIPFNITTSILTKLLKDNHIYDIYLIMQYEPFLRFSTNNELYLTYKYLLFKPFYEMNLEYKFKPVDFNPKPNARIILASFIRKNKPDISFNDINLYLDFISYLFSKKSKLLFEKIDKLFSDKQKEIIKKALKVEDDHLFASLTYEQIIYLFNTFNKYANDRSKKVVLSYFNQKEKEDNNPHKNFSNKNNW